MLQKESSLQTGLLILFACVFFITNTPYVLPYNGLDGTWHCTQAMAFDKGFVFGSEYTFTYGPLAFLNTCVLPQKVSVWWMVAFQCFVLFNYLEIIKEAFRKFPRYTLYIGILASVLLFPWGFVADITFTLFFFLLFWLLKLQENHSAKSMFAVIVLVTLIFFVKQNLSIIALGLTAISFIYFIVIKKLNLTITIITVAIQAMLILSLAKFFNVSLIDYVQSGMQFVSGYPEASSDIQISRKEVLLFASAEALIFGLVLLVVWRNRKLFWSNFFLYTLVAIAFFLSFKQSHVATGYLNLFGFFLFLPALMSLFKIFVREENKNFSRNILVIIVLIQMTTTQIIRYQMSGGAYAQTFMGQVPTSVAELLQKQPFTYFQKAMSFKNDMNLTNERELQIAKIEPRILERISNKTVDLLPNDASFIYFNKLNYRPRPTPQSYAIMTVQLMKRNGEAYEKPTRPNFVLYTLESFRGQNPFWNETQVTEALLKHYVVVDSTVINKKQFLLFESKPNNKALVTNATVLAERAFDEPFSLPQSKGFLRLNVKFEYSLVGKLLRFFLQPPNLYCTVTYGNGKKETFRVVTHLLESGVVASQKITTITEAKNFFTENMGQNQSIISVQFSSPIRKGFKDNVFITTTNISVNSR